MSIKALAGVLRSDYDRKVPKLRILGVMTGTSCDGLDAACIEIDSNRWKPLWSASIDYDSGLKNRVLEIQKAQNPQPVRAWLELDRDLGEWYATSIAKILRSHSKQLPDLISNHGQTVAHFPESEVTLQLGDPTRIAAKTDISVVSHFRNGDMAIGGQGAPLAPKFHAILARTFSKSKGVAIHNIGGFSNLTYISPKNEVIAFDTGPANIFIDCATELVTGGKEKFDRGGKIAASAQINTSDLEKLLAHPFFKLPFPKSTGRDDFTTDWFLQNAHARDSSLVATATALSARTIADAYRGLVSKKRPLSAIYFTGGGTKNAFLVSEVQKLLPEIQISTIEKAGFDSQLIEAQAFAVFGFLSVLGLPVGGSWTGVKEFGPPGQITPGKNWAGALKKISAFSKKPKFL